MIETLVNLYKLNHKNNKYLDFKLILKYRIISN